MKIEKTTRKILSSDKTHELAGLVYVPDCEWKGIFQIAHGMREYIDLYDDFMSEIAEEGYIVFGYDHLGHGHTAKNREEMGFFSHRDGWVHLVDDVTVFAEEIRKQYGMDLPYILMGFSMGSFIVRLNAVKYNKQDKLIVMGTGGFHPEVDLGLSLLRTIKDLRGDYYVSRSIQRMVFGSYNNRFPDCGELGWLTSIKENRDAYANDPLCSFEFGMSAMEDLIRLSAESNRIHWYKEMDKEKPVILLSGSEDPLGDYGKGISKIHEWLIENDVKAELRLYEGCRHVILKDKCREEVIRDIKYFLQNDKLPQA